MSVTPLPPLTTPLSPPRQEKRSEGRILLGWWWWMVKIWCRTLSLWTVGSAMWTSSQERASCWESVSTVSAKSAYAQSSWWVRSLRCPVPTEMTLTPAPARCRRGRSEHWCQQRIMNAGCREDFQSQSLGARAAIIVQLQIVWAGVCTRIPSMSSTVLSVGNTTA